MRIDGEKLRDIRKNQNVSQDRLSEITGISQAYISMLERENRSTTWENIKIICEALECFPEHILIDGEPSPLVQIKRSLRKLSGSQAILVAGLIKEFVKVNSKGQA